MNIGSVGKLEAYPTCHHRPNQKTPAPGKTVEQWPAVDVLVCGGGPAGIAAAMMAARAGAKTLLVERYGRLGGMAVQAKHRAARRGCRPDSKRSS